MNLYLLPKYTKFNKTLNRINIKALPKTKAYINPDAYNEYEPKHVPTHNRTVSTPKHKYQSKPNITVKAPKVPPIKISVSSIKKKKRALPTWRRLRKTSIPLSKNSVEKITVNPKRKSSPQQQASSHPITSNQKWFRNHKAKTELKAIDEAVDEIVPNTNEYYRQMKLKENLKRHERGDEYKKIRESQEQDRKRLERKSRSLTEQNMHYINKIEKPFEPKKHEKKQKEKPSSEKKKGKKGNKLDTELAKLEEQHDTDSLELSAPKKKTIAEIAIADSKRYHETLNKKFVNCFYRTCCELYCWVTVIGIVICIIIYL